MRRGLNQTEGLALFDQRPVDSTPGPTRRVAVRAHLRRVTGDPSVSGAERRDAALDRHAAHAGVQVALAYVRDRLAALYQLRARTPSWGSHPYVTADDADAILREWATCPADVLTLPSQNWRGTIFRGASWARTGQRVISTRDHMRSTELPCWRYVPTARSGAA